MEIVTTTPLANPNRITAAKVAAARLERERAVTEQYSVSAQSAGSRVSLER